MTTLLDWSARTDLIDLVPLVARTATGSGSAFNVQPYTGRAMVIFEAAAPTGTSPTLSNLRLQESADGATGWADIVNDLSGEVRFTNVAGVASLQRRWFDVGATRGFVRAVWNIGGTTPSWTFSLLMLARQT